MKVEIRDGKVHIHGYVNAVDRFSLPLPDRAGKTFIEKITPGTFRRAIDSADDIGIMLNHERKLTSVKKSGATLKEDNIGLLFDGEFSDPEIIEAAREKKLRGWSFGFIPTKTQDKESDRDGIDYERTVSEMELHEISIIDSKKTPAYPATSVEIRTTEQEFDYGAPENEPQQKRAQAGRHRQKLRRKKLELLKTL